MGGRGPWAPTCKCEVEVCVLSPGLLLCCPGSGLSIWGSMRQLRPRPHSDWSVVAQFQQHPQLRHVAQAQAPKSGVPSSKDAIL